MVLNIFVIRFLFVLLLFAAGCTWQQEKIVPTAPPSPDGILGVEVLSSRTLDGAEHFTEYVYPNTRDSVQYIIVNDTIVWQATPFWMDSLAPYHIDGRTNRVTMVWPTVSKVDTESARTFPLEILAPLPGDTIDKSKGITVQFPPLDRSFGKQLFLDDGIDTLYFGLDTTGTILIADTSLQKLHGSFLRVTFNVQDSYAFWNHTETYSTFIDAYRSIEYPMK